MNSALVQPASLPRKCVQGEQICRTPLEHGMFTRFGGPPPSDPQLHCSHQSIALMRCIFLRASRVPHDVLLKRHPAPRLRRHCATRPRLGSSDLWCQASTLSAVQENWRRLGLGVYNLSPPDLKCSKLSNQAPKMAPRFLLSRASPADMPEIVALQYASFPPVIRQAFMGCSSEADLPRLISKYTEKMTSDPYSVWLKVVDEGRVTEAGKQRIVAACNWDVYPNAHAPAPASTDDGPPEWLQGEARERSAKMNRDINEARRASMPGGFVHLHICFTDPDYRRQGAGKLMMDWGCEVADRLFLPAWIEASPEGNQLYVKHGFYDVGKAGGGLDGTNMRRDPRVSTMTVERDTR
ncbi:hypothetical protein F5Y15DRAFT_103971 [Xylariaceae sp. FL0016]|nr:hypothetical protein F5Y15DRAFT_103971 [Xylariaceae sp. FL0016]